MYKCICIHIHMHTHAFMHIYTYTYAYIHIHTCTRIYIYICINVNAETVIYIMCKNKSFRYIDKTIKTYQQDRIGLTPIYVKGIIMDYGIHVRPLIV